MPRKVQKEVLKKIPRNSQRKIVNLPKQLSSRLKAAEKKAIVFEKEAQEYETALVVLKATIKVKAADVLAIWKTVHPNPVQCSAGNCTWCKEFLRVTKELTMLGT